MEIQLQDQEQEMQYQGQIWNHICGNVDTQVLKCAIKLGVFDTIQNSDKSMLDLTEMSSSLSLSPIKPENLYRLLRYLTHMNLVTLTSVEGTEMFSLTDLSKLLLGNQEKSLKDWALGIGHEEGMGVWHELSSSCSMLAGGPTPWEMVFGEGCYEYTDKELGDTFNKAMSSDTRLAMPAVIRGCDKILRGLNSLVDVGGGNGTAMSYVVKAFPHVKCTVFDLPKVVERAQECHGVEFIGGDMFTSIPPADAVFLKFMLHNWGEAESINILRKCKEAIPADKGMVIIMDIVLDQDDEDDIDIVRAKLSLDLDMMCIGGRERTKEEWKNLLEISGFTRHEFLPIVAIQSIIVANYASD
ncbi:3'-hydroxy-N-methyl-(S)-coclaurine 4'-O-methyltransferase 2-like isoform X1 [Papaver somniferum]|uniref:3'-hydroxy-N-methyl-(S)-coclaurine 4'-O-methyltransferase 2-like isoform X1 n=1 Tax=Papaver somniferum TaxID=3469 RepID=UPI000E6FC0D7|nr:3'-hydroxy-N-methyl-(S)-coclaurine 4'-O-methyltransferase 2-like isoform X1 [Papaver somniferum]